MAETDPISPEQIAVNAAEPKRARGDSGEVEQHPIADQILADEYRRKSAASRRPAASLRYAKFKPGGTV